MEDPEQQQAFNLARERIAAAKESGARALNLSPDEFTFDDTTYSGDERFAQLAELPPGIADLSALQALYLRDTQVADVAPLARLSTLQELNLHNTRVTDISPLVELRALQTLNLHQTQIDDIALVAQLPTLRILNLGNTRVVDIAPVAGLRELAALSLTNTKVADITPLSDLSALEWLSLRRSQVADLAPIAGLKALRNLAFADSPACASDPNLAELAKIRNDEERTRRTLAYLRGEKPDSEASEAEPETKAPARKAATRKRSGPSSKAAKASPRTRGARAPTSRQVRTVQEALTDAGFDPGAVDGIAGAATQQAMQRALERSKIDTTGNLWSDFNNLKDFLEELKRPTPRPDETAPFYSDRPATQDLLNRRAVAETLGTIVDEVWKEAQAADDAEKANPGARPEARDRTFIVHLHGRWGSGKTSILNFLREVLLSGDIAREAPKDAYLGHTPDPPWVVVDYNAWRNQGLGPAWWTLMDTVYREGAAQLGGWRKDDGQKVLLSHYWWRFRARWLEYVSVLLIAVAVVLAVFQFDLGEGWLDKAKNTGTVVAVIVAVIAFLNRLSIGTARTAKRYMELTRDPVTPLIERYSELIEDIGRPVAVFIDDLDRCDAQFVVELMQNIQTLFRRAQVLYVVAADRGWICTSYEQVYAPYCESIAEPGHSLGNMFLEKIFQLSVEVPSLAGAQRDAFWDHLIQMRDKKVTREDQEAIEAEVEKELEAADTEEKVIEIVDKHAKRGPEHAAVAGARAFKHMQESKALVAEREHFLAQYAHLLEANPRAMKRLLNAYGFRRGFDIQSSHRSDPDALVRWTILENRWPLLADCLAGRSDGRIDTTTMEALMRTPEVRAVIEGLTRDKLAPIVGAPDVE